MPDEIWPEPKTEMGLCILCARCREDCLQSTQGWVCRECWQKILQSPEPPGNLGRLAILPDQHQYGYMIVDYDCTLVAIGGVLFFFRCQRHAEEVLERLRKIGRDRRSRIIRVSSISPFLYAMKHPDIKLVFVRDANLNGLDVKP